MDKKRVKPIVNYEFAHDPEMHEVAMVFKADSKIEPEDFLLHAQTFLDMIKESLHDIYSGRDELETDLTLN